MSTAIPLTTICSDWKILCEWWNWLK